MINIKNNSDNSDNNLGLIKLNSIDSFKIINPNLQEELQNFQETNIKYQIQNNISNENLGLDIAELNKINTLTNPNLVYTELLNEIYEIINDNSQLFENKNLNISKPDIKYENRKTFWINYNKNCSQINRSVQQFKKFLETELAVETSINEKSNLILKGKYHFNILASTYKKYIKNYVQCSTCKSINTEITRNSSNRLDYLKCLNQKCNTCKVVIKI